jgi:hypothetical protein
MASLSRKVSNQADKKSKEPVSYSDSQNVADDRSPLQSPVPTPVASHTNVAIHPPYDPVHISAPEDDLKRFERVLFIADTDISHQLASELYEYSNIRRFEISRFQNRNCQQLAELGVQNIWLNIKGEAARQWLGLNLKRTTPFTAIAVYSVDKRSKWIADVKDHVEYVCKQSDIKRLKSIGHLELLEMLASGMKFIHGKPSKIAKYLGCSRLITKSQQKNSLGR